MAGIFGVRENALSLSPPPPSRVYPKRGVTQPSLGEDVWAPFPNRRRGGVIRRGMMATVWALAPQRRRRRRRIRRVSARTSSGWGGGGYSPLPAMCVTQPPNPQYMWYEIPFIWNPPMSAIYFFYAHTTSLCHRLMTNWFWIARLLPQLTWLNRSPYWGGKMIRTGCGNSKGRTMWVHVEMAMQNAR